MASSELPLMSWWRQQQRQQLVAARLQREKPQRRQRWPKRLPNASASGNRAEARSERERGHS